MKGKTIRRAALSIALGACLGSMAPMAMAQAVTGAVAGRANAGETITVTNTATGASRTVTVGGDGTYRVAQLPPGDYTLKAGSGEPIAVSVSLGGTTSVNLDSSGAVNLDTVQVVGSRVVNRVDVHSTETATNISRTELARLPVDQSLGSVALLAPGVITGNASFGGISFGGSSVAENQIYINGLNVTDFYQRQGNSSAPFAFFDQFQVKTGGYGVEFGRSTGGVINATVRSGSNEFHGGIELTMQPEGMSASADDHVYEHEHDATSYWRASRDESTLYKTNAWASGPIVKDKLFFFAMYEVQDSYSGYTNNNGTSWSEYNADNGFWGTKLDWNISDNHQLSLMAFSDEADSTTSAYGYDWDSMTVGDYGGDTLAESGGKNWTLTYTGHFGDNFTAKAMVGANERTSFSRSLLDEYCNPVSYDASYDGAAALQAALEAADATLGCHPTGSSIVKRDNTREVGRLDFEWTLGNHLLRFGTDLEKLTTESTSFYPGPGGVSYQAQTRDAGDEIWDTSGVVVTEDTDVVRARLNIAGGTFETVNNAFYVEDNWNITDAFLLNLGVRIDNFEYKTASGETFIDMNNLVAPRAGFSWDMKGDGSTKLYGNLGRYYLPITNRISEAFAGGYTDEYSYYALQGWDEQVNPVTGSAYLVPVLGAQIGPTDTRLNAGADDLRSVFPKDLRAVYQDEAILGFQQAINTEWSWGVNATYRRMERTVEDTRITHSDCPTGFNWPILNPGETNTLWCEGANDGAGGWVTIDTSVDGYTKTDGTVIGYNKPKRVYKALEFQIDRAWDEKWSFNASYLLSRSEGNFEGPVNSDTNYADAGMVQYYDHPAVNERYGVLFNDHTHQIKLRGAYALSKQWSFGGSLTAMSGAPITAFGTYWPGDNRAAGSTSEYSGGGSGWICVQNCSASYDQRVYEYTKRGAFGRLPWTYNLGASVTWTLPVDGIDLKARLSVYNLLNEQEATNYRSRYEVSPGVYRETFGEARGWQSPRYMNLVVTWNF